MDAVTNYIPSEAARPYFERMHLPTLVDGPSIEDILCALHNVPAGGCFVEVGVFRGGTAQFIEMRAIETGRQFFAYDTFTGIPYSDEIDKHVPGDFEETDYEMVQAALAHTTVVKGVFPGSAVPMPPIAFAHIDCDQYRSIKESVEYLRDKMVPGGIMLFDDFSSLEGAKKAVLELFPDKLLLTPQGKAAYIF